MANIFVGQEVVQRKRARECVSVYWDGPGEDTKGVPVGMAGTVTKVTLREPGVSPLALVRYENGVHLELDVLWLDPLFTFMHCAECDSPLTAVDYLCQGCRA